MSVLENQTESSPRHAFRETHDVSNPESARARFMASKLGIGELEANKKAGEVLPLILLDLAFPEQVPRARNKEETRSTHLEESLGGELHLDEKVDAQMFRLPRLTMILSIVSIAFSAFLVAVAFAATFQIRLGGFVTTYLLVGGVGLAASTIAFISRTADDR